jgi:hypothetical protein
LLLASAPINRFLSISFREARTKSSDVVNGFPTAYCRPTVRRPSNSYAAKWLLHAKKD